MPNALRSEGASRQSEVEEDRSQVGAGRGRRKDVGLHDRLLCELSESFSRFRASRGSRRTIPDELRSAVLKALDEGLTPGRVRYACGVKATQIDTWRTTQGRSTQRASRQAASEAVTPPAKILPVVPSPPLAPKASPAASGFDTASTTGAPLTLWLGGWSVTLQRLPQ